jgi:hypothetical protein
LDRFIAALKLDTNYWGPYTSPKSAGKNGKWIGILLVYWDGTPES